MNSSKEIGYALHFFKFSFFFFFFIYMITPLRLPLFPTVAHLLDDGNIIWDDLKLWIMQLISAS